MLWRDILEGMIEIQGPTPAGTSRPYRNLAEALRAHRIDPVNHAFIAEIVDVVGITSFIDRGRYIEAVRRGDGAALHIGRTYTNGFTEDEVITVGSARLRLQLSEGRAPYFFVVHPSEFAPSKPVRKTRTAASARIVAPASTVARPPKPVERDYGVCDVCFMTRTPAGTCGC